MNVASRMLVMQKKIVLVLANVYECLCPKQDSFCGTCGIKLNHMLKLRSEQKSKHIWRRKLVHSHR